jgi:hypothetical protein
MTSKTNLKINCGHGLHNLDWSEDGDHIQVKTYSVEMPT